MVNRLSKPQIKKTEELVVMAHPTLYPSASLLAESQCPFFNEENEIRQNWTFKHLKSINTTF